MTMVTCSGHVHQVTDAWVAYMILDLDKEVKNSSIVKNVLVYSLIEFDCKS